MFATFYPFNMKGLDISFSAVWPEWAAARYAEGFRIFFQCLWTGGFAGQEGIKAVAENNLRIMREAGFKCYGYSNASPPEWWAIEVQVGNTKRNAGAEWDSLLGVAIDVEIPGITFERADELGLAFGSTMCYSAKWFWDGHMGSTTDLRWWFAFPKLWNAFYDFDPDIDFAASPYGPWGIEDVIGEQYQGTTFIDGVQVDLNNFDESYFAVEQEDEMTPAQSERLLQLMEAQNHMMQALVTAFVGDLDTSDSDFDNYYELISTGKGMHPKAPRTFTVELIETP